MFDDDTPEEERVRRLATHGMAALQLLQDLTALGDGEITLFRASLRSDLLIRYTWTIGPHAGAFVEVARQPRDLARGLFVLKGQVQLVRAGYAGSAQRLQLELQN